jgi:hypothetical protein
MPSRGFEHRARYLWVQLASYSINQHHTGLTWEKRFMWFFYTFRIFRYYLWAVRSITQLLEFTVEIGYGNRLVFTGEAGWLSVARKTGAHTTYNANARGDVFRTARHNKFKINARPQMENIDKQPLRPGCREGEIYAFKSRHFFGNHQTKNINTGPRRKSILITTPKIWPTIKCWE